MPAHFLNSWSFFFFLGFFMILSTNRYISLTTPTDRPDLLINSHKLFPRMIKEKHSKISSRYPKVTPHQNHHDTYYSWWEGVNTQILNTRLISQILEYMQSYHKLFCNILLTRMLWTNLHASTFAPSSTTAWPSNQPSGQPSMSSSPSLTTNPSSNPSILPSNSPSTSYNVRYMGLFLRTASCIVLLIHLSGFYTLATNPIYSFWIIQCHRQQLFFRQLQILGRI